MGGLAWSDLCRGLGWQGSATAGSSVRNYLPGPETELPNTAQVPRLSDRTALTDTCSGEGCPAAPLPGQRVSASTPTPTPGRGTQPGTGGSLGPGGKKPAPRAQLCCGHLGQRSLDLTSIPSACEQGWQVDQVLTTVPANVSLYLRRGSTLDLPLLDLACSENPLRSCECSWHLPADDDPK